MPDMSKYRSELNLTISFGYRKLMSEGNACAEGGKARDRRGRVMRGRSMSEGQTTNGGRWEGGVLSSGGEGGRQL